MLFLSICPINFSFFPAVCMHLIAWSKGDWSIDYHFCTVFLTWWQALTALFGTFLCTSITFVFAKQALQPKTHGADTFTRLSCVRFTIIVWPALGCLYDKLSSIFLCRCNICQTVSVIFAIRNWFMTFSICCAVSEVWIVQDDLLGRSWRDKICAGWRFF